MISEVRVSQTSTIPPVMVGKENKNQGRKKKTEQIDTLSKDGQKGKSDKDRTDVGTNQRPDTLVAFVRNLKGCEDTQQPVRGCWHC
jgi:hypothetical protein